MALGSRITGLAQTAGHAVGIDIRRPGLVLFRAALPGITPDQETWIVRKAALVLRMESSSALVEARFSSAGIDAAAIGWLGADYAITGIVPRTSPRRRCRRRRPPPASPRRKTTTSSSKASGSTSPLRPRPSIIR